MNYPEGKFIDIYSAEIALDKITVDDDGILQVQGFGSRTKEFINTHRFRQIHMKKSEFKTDKTLITGFYLGYWQSHGTKYSRSIYNLLKCLQNIGGMNKILTDIGSWMNLFFCAGLIRVYFAQ